MNLSRCLHWANQLDSPSTLGADVPGVSRAQSDQARGSCRRCEGSVREGRDLQHVADLDANVESSGARGVALAHRSDGAAPVTARYSDVPPV